MNIFFTGYIFNMQMEKCKEELNHFIIVVLQIDKLTRLLILSFDYFITRYNVIQCI